MASAKPSKLENYYDKLGLQSNATSVDIDKQINYKLAMNTDKYAPRDDDEVELLHKIRTTLLDPALRMQYDMSLLPTATPSPSGLPVMASNVQIKFGYNWFPARDYQIEAVNNFYKTQDKPGGEIKYNKDGIVFKLKREEDLNNALYLIRDDGTKSPIIDLNRIFIKIKEGANFKWVPARDYQQDAYLNRMYNDEANDKYLFIAPKGTFTIVSKGSGRMNMIRDDGSIAVSITDNINYIAELGATPKIFSGGAKVKKSKSKHSKRSRRSNKAKSNRKSRN
jgi:hypothetical protein